MNSEELEVSLRSEFENYLKNVFAEMRQDISQLQEKIEGELDAYRAQLDSVFKEAMSRADREHEFDAGFTEAVVEHLRLAKDEGARITATAIAEAEEMEKQARAEAEANAAAAPKAGVKEVYEAVSDISAKHSQADILKTLVQHAGQFTPRGALFIVKNEYFVGWRTFGIEKGDEAVQEVFTSVSSDSVLGEAYRSLAAVETNAGTFADDEEILNKLGFENSSDKMYAIPLVVRGRTVAVLYADYGEEGGEINVEALETMVRVASLTVEVLASAKSSSKESKRKPARAFAGEGLAPVAEEEPKESGQPEYAGVSNYNAPVSENSYQSSFESESYAQPAFREEPAEQQGQQYSAFEDYESAPVQEEETSEPQAEQQQQPAYQEQSWNAIPVEAVSDSEDFSSRYNEGSEYAQDSSAEPTASYTQDFSTETSANDYSADFSYQPPVEQETSSDLSSSPTNEYQFDYQSGGNQSFETQPSEVSYESAPVAESYAPAGEESFSSQQAETPNTVETSFAPTVEEPISQPVQEASTPPVKSRFSDRNVDLPIEVTEDERRLHNDARRFARLLVSEIKLYNEEKVKEGRESGDLYDRLREAIDRSREMYDKRIQPPVAAKFDYFHYELVNSLAEGDASKLGAEYPGAYI